MSSLEMSLRSRVLPTNKVRVDRSAHTTTRGGATILLVPEQAASDTAELVRDQVLTALRATGLVRMGGEGLPRRKLNPPYGYQRAADRVMTADPQAGPAIAEAFRLILAGADASGNVPWAAVAAALNRQGYCRRNGEPWRGDDVRDLTRVATYAGYVHRDWRAGDDDKAEIERAAEIPQPLVDLSTFVRAAAQGRRRGTRWLTQLEAIVYSTVPGMAAQRNVVSAEADHGD